MTIHDNRGVGSNFVRPSPFLPLPFPRPSPPLSSLPTQTSSPSALPLSTSPVLPVPLSSPLVVRGSGGLTAGIFLHRYIAVGEF